MRELCNLTHLPFQHFSIIYIMIKYNTQISYNSINNNNINIMKMMKIIKHDIYNK